MTNNNLIQFFIVIRGKIDSKMETIHKFSRALTNVE
jgi:hypothetical protein